jgi:hypothetical protein
MTRFRRLRVLVSLASLLLLAGLTAYVSHHHEAGDQSRSAEHCDLCLQLGAAAGAPVYLPPTVAMGIPAYWLPITADGVRSGRGFLHPIQARAPPDAQHC